MATQENDKRKSITDNQNQLFLSEVGGLCPLCAKDLIVKHKTKYVKHYQIAHIYPCNPTSNDLAVLAGITPPIDIEAYDNKIALCLDCHISYDHDKTLEQYNHLRSLKNRLIEESKLKSLFADYPLESQINTILTKLSTIGNPVSNETLNVKALKITQKIGDLSNLFCVKISDYVSKYFLLVQTMLKELGTDSFNCIATQIKSFYNKCKLETSDKRLIFNKIIEWVKVKTENTDIEACEIVVSYFIQNCEVFDEITQ